MKIRIVSAVVLTVALVTGSGLSAAEGVRESVPVEYQAVIFKKVVDRFFPAMTGDTTVTVVYNDANVAEKDAVLATFQQVNFKIEAVKADQLDQVKGDILYLPAGTSKAVLKQAAASKRFVLTANRDYVDAGYASMGIVDRKQRPTLVANIQHLADSKTSVDLSFFRYIQVVDKFDL